MASLPVIGRQDANHIGSFHLGTFAVNMIACLCYAALVTYLTQAPWIHAKRRELISRAFGMGVCGGLSTLSTLALEVFTSLRGGNALEAVLYIVITFACGFIVALIGVRCSNWLLDHHDNVEYSKDPQATDTREAQQ
jgi:CrcB protein